MHRYKFWPVSIKAGCFNILYCTILSLLIVGHLYLSSLLFPWKYCKLSARWLYFTEYITTYMFPIIRTEHYRIDLNFRKWSTLCPEAIKDISKVFDSQIGRLIDSTKRPGWLLYPEFRYQVRETVTKNGIDFGLIIKVTYVNHWQS